MGGNTLPNSSTGQHLDVHSRWKTTCSTRWSTETKFTLLRVRYITQYGFSYKISLKSRMESPELRSLSKARVGTVPSWRNFSQKKATTFRGCRSVRRRTHRDHRELHKFFLYCFQDQFEQYFPYFLVETYHSKNLFGYRRWWRSHKPA